MSREVGERHREGEVASVGITIEADIAVSD